MHILGISAFYHDSAACLVKDGQIIAAAQEERFTRKKHDYAFPKEAVNYCLKYADISSSDISYVVFYEKPLTKFERILQTYLAYAPYGISSFLKAIPLWIKKKLWIPEIIKKELNYNGKILFLEHHESHAASAFYPSPFEKAAILTLDAVGEWDTVSYGVGDGNKIELLQEMKFPHSLGMLYSAFTYYLGFKVNSGEYKVMGLAPYGEPKFVKTILDNLIDLKQDGSFRLNMKYFDYCAGLTMTNNNFDKLFGGKPRKPETQMNQKHMDIARSIQEVTEEVMLRMAKYVHEKTGQSYLCLAGGVALNCVGNGKILREGPFKDIWIQPAAGDAGAALGAALFVWHNYLNNERKVCENKDFQKGSYFGPRYTASDIQDVLIKYDIPHKKIAADKIAEVVADLVAKENVIGWFQGRMEFGPRALGARSIIGDARSKNMQSIMNLKIKHRESFRPFAPTVLKEKVSEYFELDRESPYMLLTAPVKEERRINTEGKDKDLFGLEKLKFIRSEIPAVTHVDYSARVQTINREHNALYYDMINEFSRATDCPVIINTSFNRRGEPIVCTPTDALNCFLKTDINYLIMENFLVSKEEVKNKNIEVKSAEKLELD